MMRSSSGWMLAAAAQLAPLHVVDGVLAAEHEQEEQRREPPAEADDEPGADAVERGSARGRRSRCG